MLTIGTRTARAREPDKLCERNRALVLKLKIKWRVKIIFLKMIKLVQSTKRYKQHYSGIARILDPMSYGFTIEFPKDYEQFIEEYGECKIEDFIHIFPHSRVYFRTKNLRSSTAFLNFMLSFNEEIDRENFVNNVIQIGSGDEKDIIMFYNDYYYIFLYAVDELWLKFETLNEVFESYARGDYWEAFELNNFTPVCDYISEE